MFTNGRVFLLQISQVNSVVLNFYRKQKFLMNHDTLAPMYRAVRVGSQVLQFSEDHPKTSEDSREPPKFQTCWGPKIITMPVYRINFSCDMEKHEFKISSVLILPSFHPPGTLLYKLLAIEVSFGVDATRKMLMVANQKLFYNSPGFTQGIHLKFMQILLRKNIWDATSAVKFVRD